MDKTLQRTSIHHIVQELCGTFLRKRSVNSRRRCIAKRKRSAAARRRGVLQGIWFGASSFSFTSCKAEAIPRRNAALLQGNVASSLVSGTRFRVYVAFYDLFTTSAEGVAAFNPWIVVLSPSDAAYPRLPWRFPARPRRVTGILDSRLREMPQRLPVQPSGGSGVAFVRAAPSARLNLPHLRCHCRGLLEEP